MHRKRFQRGRAEQARKRGRGERGAEGKGENKGKEILAGRKTKRTQTRQEGRDTPSLAVSQRYKTLPGAMGEAGLMSFIFRNCKKKKKTNSEKNIFCRLIIGQTELPSCFASLCFKSRSSEGPMTLKSFILFPSLRNAAVFGVNVLSVLGDSSEHGPRGSGETCGVSVCDIKLGCVRICQVADIKESCCSCMLGQKSKPSVRRPA